MRSVLFILFIFLFHPAAANSYFFSTSLGDDSRSELEAQNPSTPWKTLDKLNSLHILKPGDSILFQKGEIFYGSITINASGTWNREIVYDSYGTGPNPVISGFKLVDSWTQANGLIYYATLDMPHLNLVTINGVVKAMGRYPNNGYLTYTSHSENESISGAAIGTVPFDAAGAEVVIRKLRWILDRHPVSSHSGNTITYTTSDTYGESSRYDPVDGNGFFLQGHLGTLDQFGEWYYDDAAHRLYMHFGTGAPSGVMVKASTIDKNILINTWHHIIFNNLTFEGGNTYGAYNIGTNNITYNGCIFRQQGGTAVYGIDVSDITINGGSTIDALNNGIWIELNGNSTRIEGVAVVNSGVIPGAGRSGDGAQQGIAVSGDNTVIRNCSVIHTGYTAINFYGSNVLVEHNVVDTFCTVKDDGGGIYTYTGQSATKTFVNRRVTGNIILHGIGVGAGSNDAHSVHVHGIYMDDVAENVVVNNNTVAHCGESGIFIHEARSLTITGNTFFDNKTGLYMDEDLNRPDALIRNNTIKHNNFFAKDDNQLASSIRSVTNDIQQFGDFDSNYYCRPLGDGFIIATTYDNAGINLQYGHDLSSWQTNYEQDRHSKTAPVQLSSYKLNSLTGSNLFANGDFNSNTAGVSSWSAANNCQTSWINGNKLDAGALQVAFTSRSQTNKPAYVTLDIGAIAPSKNYVLRFSLLGTKNKGNIQVYLRKKKSPYNDINVRRYCMSSTGRSEHELLFSLPSSEADAFLVFKVNEYDSTVWIDNVKLYEAKVALTNPDDFIRFEYNASNAGKTVNLSNNTYVDAENHFYSGTIVLAPWSSVVLIKGAPAVLPVQMMKFSGETIGGHAIRLKWSTATQPLSNFFEIQRSANGREFTTLGLLDPSQNPDGGFYHFDDVKPMEGNNYYRIKLIDQDGKAGYSQTILIRDLKELRQLAAFPNPVHNRTSVTYPSYLSGQSLLLRIVNAAGHEVEKKTFKTAGNSLLLDMSALTKGIYFLEVSSGSAVYNTTIYKQ